MRLQGGRTGVRAVTCENLELTGLMKPFSLEIFYGERVAVLGSNGSGKSHFLRLLAGDDVAHTGEWKLGARVVPGHFAQTHAHPELQGRTLVDILWTEHAKDRGGAMSVLRRYELERAGRPALREALRRPAGPLPDPAAGAGRAHGAAAGRADGQPGPGVGGGAAGGPGGVRGHGARGHPRPLVRPLLRPLSGLRLGRVRPGDAGAGLGRAQGGGQERHLRVVGATGPLVGGGAWGRCWGPWAC